MYFFMYSMYSLFEIYCLNSKNIFPSLEAVILYILGPSVFMKKDHEAFLERILNVVEHLYIREIEICVLLTL